LTCLDPVPVTIERPEVVGVGVVNVVVLVPAVVEPLVIAAFEPSVRGFPVANPVVAGAGALVENTYDGGEYLDEDENPTEGSPTPALVKALLINGAHTFNLSKDPDDIDGAEDDYVNPDNTRHLQGWGQPNVTELADNEFHVYTVDETVNLTTGSRYKVDYDLPDDVEDLDLRVTLTWTDPPAPSGQRLMKDRTDNEANVSALVNDLDLEVEAPNGTTYLGNGGLMSDDRSDPVNSSTVGYPVTDADRVNNVENVFVEDVENEAGIWTTTIKATSILGDAVPSTSAIEQPFGLVIRPMGETADDGGGGSGGGGGCCDTEIFRFPHAN
jgi:hypothetical protein